MIVREPTFGRRPFGQDADAAVITAAVPEPPAPAGASLFPYYLMAVAAGVTVWFITRALARKR